MIRNLQSHFALNPTLETDTIRSKFRRTNKHLTTGNAGDIIVCYIDEMYPGDTFNMKTGVLTRMSTPAVPVMSDAYQDLYSFFVPYRLIWEHWEEFMGENKTSAYEQPVQYSIPQINAPTGGWAKGTIADYMGLPTKVEGLQVSALPFRAYAKIINDWFRDENLVNPCNITLGDETIDGSNGSTHEIDVEKGGKPFVAAKLADYFTTCLPKMQKGPDVKLPLGLSAPVIGNGNAIYLTNGQNDYTLTAGTITNSFKGLYLGSNGGEIGEQTGYSTGATNEVIYGLSTNKDKSGMYADLTNATSANIIQLRQALSIQSFYEQLNRGGSRYIEIIYNMFGVTSSDARLQRSEYLGGKRFLLNMETVVQTSGTTETSPQGNIAGYSSTINTEDEWTYSAEEHGIVMCLSVIRYPHDYEQGIERFWSEKDKFDKYWTTFNGIGDQAVLQKEIRATGTNTDEEVFGYQERYGHMRYKPNRITGAFRSNYEQTLNVFHYGDYYTDKPVLGPEWIKENKENVNRTLAVQSELEDQFLMDFYFENTCVRPMPAYSIPGMRSYL